MNTTDSSSSIPAPAPAPAPQGLFAHAVAPIVLGGHGVRLVPLSLDHVDGLRKAAADGALWNLRVSSVPRPDDTTAYIERALRGQGKGAMLPFAVQDADGGMVLGTTRYYDILPDLGRLDIGYTWYARSFQRTHVNTACKLLLLQHAFEVLGAAAVGWRTDYFNFASQRAIERLGAHKDGILRHHRLRRDGTIRDTVVYSLMAGEWPEVRAHLLYLLHCAHDAASD